MLSEAALNRYQADGFVIYPEPLFSGADIDAALAGVSAIKGGEYDLGMEPVWSAWHPGDPESSLCKIEFPHIANSAIRNLITHPRLGRALAELMGASWVQIWWVQLLDKPPVSIHDNTVIGWHQDAQYWADWDPNAQMLSAWIPLTDVTVSSGPLRFVAGSHHWGLQEAGAFYEQDLEGTKQAYLQSIGKWGEERVVIIPRGACSFHHKLVVHGSSHNHSYRNRTAIAVHARSERTAPVGELQGKTAHIRKEHWCPVVYDSTNLGR